MFSKLLSNVMPTYGNKTLEFVEVVSMTLPTRPLWLIADIFSLILSSNPALIFISFENKVSFLLTKEAVLISVNNVVLEPTVAYQINVSSR